MRRLRWLLPVVMLIAVFAGGSTVSGHALLTSAEPPPNAQVREPPEVLVLHFSEPLERKYSKVEVVDQSGARVDERVEFDDSDDALMRVVLRDVTPGYLSVQWATVSSIDGHRITGSYPLTILNPDGGVPAGRPPASVMLTAGAEADPLRVIDRAFLLIAGAALTGAFAFAVFVTPGLPDRSVRGRIERLVLIVCGLAMVVLVVAGVVELLLQARELDVAAGDVLDTRWGERWLCRNLALIGVAVAVVGGFVVSGAPRRYAAAGGLLFAIVYLAVTASVSHAAAGAGAFWAYTSDFVHLLAASVWIGMLALLIAMFLVVRRSIAEPDRYPVEAAGLQRFSIVAVVSVALLLFTGTFNAIVHIGDVSDLWEGILTGNARESFPTYGNTLFLKLLLLVPLLLAGASNAYLLRPDLVDEVENPGNPRGRPERLAAGELRLRKTLRWEVGLAVAVLAITALLVQLTPTRGRLETPTLGTGRYVASAESGGIASTLVIDPNRAGNNTFEVYLTGAVETVESVRLQFWPNGDASQESRLVLEPSNPPVFYLGQGPYLAQPGKWEVQVFIRRAAGTGADIALPFKLTVPDAAGNVVAPRTGGTFAFPVTLSLSSALLLAASGLFSVCVVYVSIRRPGLPGGYGSVLAEIVAERMPTIRPAWSLAVLIIVGIGLGLIVGAHRDAPLSEQQATAGNPIPTSPESVAKGQMIFSTNCTMCHGESGRGDGPLAPSLSIKPANLYDHIPYHPDQFFFNVITNGVGGVMPSFKDSLSEEERWHILNYLRATFTEQPATQ